MSGQGHEFVRPFIMTGGRTRTERRDLRLETMLQARAEHLPMDLPPEQVDLLRACAGPLSIAEIASRLGLVVGVVQVIAGDLIERELVEVHQTDPVEIELDMLTKMIERVRAI